VVGKEELENKTVDLRDGEKSESIGKYTIEKLLELFKSHEPPKSKKRLELEAEAEKVRKA
jgi:hypothetical protein